MTRQQIKHVRKKVSIRTKTKKYGHRSLGKEQFTFLPYTYHMCTPLYSFVKLSKTLPIVLITKLQLETQQVHTLLVQLPEEGRLQSMSIVNMTSINFLMESCFGFLIENRIRRPFGLSSEFPLKKKMEKFH